MISIINLHIGLRLENLCLNGRGSLSEFAGKVTSINKFWKQEFGKFMFERARFSFGICRKSNVDRQILETRI